MSPTLTRRRLLRGGTLGLGAGLAGCAGLGSTGGPPTDGASTEEPVATTEGTGAASTPSTAAGGEKMDAATVHLTDRRLVDVAMETDLRGAGLTELSVAVVDAFGPPPLYTHPTGGFLTTDRSTMPSRPPLVKAPAETHGTATPERSVEHPVFVDVGFNQLTRRPVETVDPVSYTLSVGDDGTAVETATETVTVPSGERRTLALPEAEALVPTYRTVTLTDRTGNGTLVRKEQDGVEYHTVAPSITVRDLGELPIYAVADASDLPE